MSEEFCVRCNWCTPTVQVVDTHDITFYQHTDVDQSWFTLVCPLCSRTNIHHVNDVYEGYLRGIGVTTVLVDQDEYTFTHMDDVITEWTMDWMNFRDPAASLAYYTKATRCKYSDMAHGHKAKQEWRLAYNMSVENRLFFALVDPFYDSDCIYDGQDLDEKGGE